MTNREYLATLSSKDLSEFLYLVLFKKIGVRFSHAIYGVAEWLDQEKDDKDSATPLRNV